MANEKPSQRTPLAGCAMQVATVAIMGEGLLTLLGGLIALWFGLMELNRAVNGQQTVVAWWWIYLPMGMVMIGLGVTCIWLGMCLRSMLISPKPQ